ncbi:shufflon system plasmid conjugative transfer pilus tip adhesin PilV [Morganella psychrotolerans]|uniref:shufflon system plasmid conjugative transfer pilus tip adhesin PilV n=1 Tax=Morganella psychrotolerans TaxID=368603 RepID=UPI0039AF357C
MKGDVSKKIHRGFISIEIIAVLVIVLLSSLFGAEKYSEYLLTKEWHVAANQLQTFNSTSKLYISDNNNQIISGTLPFRITPSLLKKKGYLSSSFSEVNSFGQNYVTGVVKNPLSNSKSKLQALTCTTNGLPISEKGMRSIASEIQGLGGYISEKHQAIGAFGGWSSAPGDFGLDCRHGHVAIALSSEVLGTMLQESDRLYRFKVNHKPELNTMHTDLNMGKYDIKNINTLEANDGVFIRSVSAQGNITSDELVSGKYLLTSSEAITGARCEQNGLISKDNNGAILSCTSGIWAKGGTGVPVGTIAIWGTSKFPDEWLELNGDPFDKNKYPELAKLYTSGNLPDFRGMFLRGLDHGRKVDSEPNRLILSYQIDALQDHTHIAGTETAYNDYVPLATTRNTPGSPSLRSYLDRTGGINTSWGDVRMASENRPKNVAVIYIIKAR